MKSIATIFLFMVTVCATGQFKHADLEFLIGSFDTEVLIPDGKGQWKNGGEGSAQFYPFLDNTFIREELELTYGEGTLTMSNSIGRDHRSNEVRLIALDKEFSTMDVYKGNVVGGKLVIDNVSSDLPFVTQEGDSISFRLTYRRISAEQNESLVEMTKDGGITWSPFSKQVFTRKE